MHAGSGEIALCKLQNSLHEKDRKYLHEKMLPNPLPQVGLKLVQAREAGGNNVCLRLDSSHLQNAAQHGFNRPSMGCS